MIQIIPQMRILLCVEPVDFRKGIDGLCRICRQVFGQDPFDGALFVFCSRRRTALRILAYDGQGFWLAHKRLSTGRFRHWPDRSSLEAHELQALIWNFKVPPREVQFFKKLPK
jgi:transposase